jgi:hypothetical protein
MSEQKDFIRKKIQSEINFESETIGFHHGQSDNVITAKLNGNPVGQIDFSIYDEKIDVKYITSSLAKSGVATMMLIELKKDNENIISNGINFGMLTDDGALFIESLMEKGLLKKKESGKQGELKELECEYNNWLKGFIKERPSLKLDDIKRLTSQILNNPDVLNDNDTLWSEIKDTGALAYTHNSIFDINDLHDISERISEVYLKSEPSLYLINNNYSRIKLFQDELSKEYDLKKLSITEKGKHLNLSNIIVNKKGIGTGTKVLKDIIKYADCNNLTITLTPEINKDENTSSLNRLNNFYKKLGFVDNKGKNGDFEIFDSMYKDSNNSQLLTPKGMSLKKPK